MLSRRATERPPGRWTGQSWPSVVPPWIMLGGVGATVAIGAVAGLYPAVRAARLPPTEALATP